MSEVVAISMQKSTNVDKMIEWQEGCATKIRSLRFRILCVKQAVVFHKDVE